MASWTSNRQTAPVSLEGVVLPVGLPVGGDVEQRTLAIGRTLLHSARTHRDGLFSSRFWSDQIMNWAMKDAAFRTQLFRFVDVFPSLKGDHQVYDCLMDYLHQPGVVVPSAVTLGLKAGGLAKSLFAATITRRIRALAFGTPALCHVSCFRNCRATPYGTAGVVDAQR